MGNEVSKTCKCPLCYAEVAGHEHLNDHLIQDHARKASVEGYPLVISILVNEYGMLKMIGQTPAGTPPQMAKDATVAILKTALQQYEAGNGNTRHFTGGN
jgi:hypothetical protein